MSAYYNEIDPYAAAWLRNLIAAGHIADGEVDERDIRDVRPVDLLGFTQCHFFAGIGVWSHALRGSGWPDSRPVWTGSCPCQPFSAAGAGNGFDDDRHLWPAWFHLIAQCRPAVVFGEQVEAAIGHGWLDLVQDDLESQGYACGAVGLPAACVGAPHIRQRLWFVADAELPGHDGSALRRGVSASEENRRLLESEGCGPAGELGNTKQHRGWRNAGAIPRTQGETERGLRGEPDCAQSASNSGAPADSTNERRKRWGSSETGDGAKQPERLCNASGFWSAADWIYCRDDKWRPVEPGTFPLAHGAPSRMGRLRAYGNAIVPQVASEVIRAYLDCRP